MPLRGAAARALAALALGLGLAGPAGGQDGAGPAAGPAALPVPAPAPEDGAQTLTLGLAESRAFARQALLAGQTQLARAVALALLAADPRDPVALVVLAAAETRLGAPRAGRQAAERAFRSAGAAGGAEARRLRHDAARIAAAAALAEGRPAVAQLWLRHAVSLAPDPALRAAAEAEHRAVRAANPLQASLRLHLAPSSNVNRGSRHDALIVDGIETPFVLSGDARALPGLELGATGAVSFRLGAGRGWTLEAGGRASAITYRLSEAARRRAPEARGADFAEGRAEAGLRLHLAPAPGAAPVTLGLTAGRAWYGGDPLARSLRLDAGRTFALGPATALRLDLLTERQWRDGPGERTAAAQAIQAQLSHRRPAGDVLRLRLTAVDLRSDDRNATHRAASGEARVEFARPLGPARVALAASAGWRDYPVFMNGVFGTGRHEVTVGGAVELMFPRAEVWGLAPALTLRGARTESNISRFDSTQFGVEFAIRSTF